MRVDIEIDSSCTEPRIVIMTASVTEEIHDLVKTLSAPQVLTGVREGRLEVLEQAALIRLYAQSGKVIAVADEGEYVVRPRLYELEQRLDRSRFVRISNSEIINLKKVKSFDLSISGTICVRLSDGTVTYVSRRYVSRIKEILGV